MSGNNRIGTDRIVIGIIVSPAISLFISSNIAKPVPIVAGYAKRIAKG